MRLTTIQKSSLVAFTLVFTITLITFLLGVSLMASQPVRSVGWDALLLGLLGFGAVLLQEHAGLPGLLDPAIPGWRRWWLPAGIGLGFAAADVLVFEFLLPHDPYTSLPPFLQPFPWSLLLYTSGAIYVETLYRLLPLTLGLLLMRRFAPESWAGPGFWVLACALALIEPLEMFIGGDNLALTLYAFLSGLAFNLLIAWAYRGAGWLAGLSLRLGHYLLWHILLGIWVEFVVLGG